MPSPHRPSALRGCVFRKGDALADGLLTEGALRSTAWRRLYRGVYVDADLPPSFELCIRGAGLLLPPSASFSGRTAAYLHGAPELVDAGSPVEVSVPTGVRFGPVAGLRVRQVLLPESEVTVVRQCRATTRVRTALDIARTEPLLDSVPALDLLLRRSVVSRGELLDAAAVLVGRRGGRRAQRSVDLTDARAESQQESRLRVVLALAGLVAVPQFTVRTDQGRFVARVDLAFPDRRVAVEYDGAWHADPGQFARDRRRLNALTAVGWTVLHVTAADMRDPAALVAQVRALCRAATPGK